MLAWGVCVHVHERAPFLRKGLLERPPHPPRPACLLPLRAGQETGTKRDGRQGSGGYRTSPASDPTCSPCLACCSDP